MQQSNLLDSQEKKVSTYYGRHKISQCNHSECLEIRKNRSMQTSARNRLRKGIKHKSKMARIDWDFLASIAVEKELTSKQLSQCFDVVVDYLLFHLKMRNPEVHRFVVQTSKRKGCESSKNTKRLHPTPSPLKGKPGRFKGKTYEQIFGDPQKALARANKTSEWMKTDKNIRRFCQVVSKPQQKLFNLVKEKYVNAQLEYPVELKRGGVFWLDIALPDLKIDIEYDGRYWHDFNQKNGRIKDSSRDKALKTLGWKIIRVSEESDFQEILCQI